MKKTILKIAGNHKNLSVAQFAAYAKTSKKNVLDWLWCLQNREGLLAYVVNKGQIEIVG